MADIKSAWFGPLYPVEIAHYCWNLQRSRHCKKSADRATGNIHARSCFIT